MVWCLFDGEVWTVAITKADLLIFPVIATFFHPFHSSCLSPALKLEFPT